MRFLAEKTGGRAVINDEREQALAGVAADTRSYYWLGLRLDRAADDARHDIQVEVLRPGFRCAVARRLRRSLARDRDDAP